jgi:hypothetical protein
MAAERFTAYATAMPPCRCLEPSSVDEAVLRCRSSGLLSGSLAAYASAMHTHIHINIPVCCVCCRCLEPSLVDEADLADSAPLQFVAGVAQDLQIADERAVSMACNWVAGHCRARIVEVGGV